MFWLYIALVLLLNARGSHAAPIHSSVPREPLLGENLRTLVCSKSQPEAERTLFNITYSCLLTVVICAWTSVHPNVPPQNRGQALFWRLKMMFWTVVAPELILAWAVRQWFAAREAKDAFNNSVRGGQRSKRWTMVHGHLLIMGGYTLINRDIITLEEPVEPGWLATDDDWEHYPEFYHEYNSQLKRSELGVLTLERFKQLVKDTNVEFPVISAAEIEDKSKGDALSKLIAIVQTLWFILQCISRGTQHLALTEFELVTLALASLSAITYMFWWNKPLGIKQPVRVYIAAGPTEAGVTRREFGYDDNRIEVSAGDIVRAMVHELSPLKRAIRLIFHRLNEHCCITLLFFEAGLLVIGLLVCSMFIFSILLIFPLVILFLLHLIKAEMAEMAKEDDPIAVRAFLALGRLRYNLTYPICKFFQEWLAWAIYEDRMIISTLFIFPPLLIVLVTLLVVFSPLFTGFFFASFIFTAVFGIVTTNTVPPGSIHVPTFYAPRTMSDRYSRMIVFAIFGVIFGGIHCIGWNFSFPTRLERSFWRINSLVLTVVPFIAAPVDWVLENRRREVIPFVRIALELLMTALLAIYVLSRVSLIIQALTLLRKQPTDAFIAVDWTKYIPHIS